MIKYLQIQILADYTKCDCCLSEVSTSLRTSLDRYALVDWAALRIFVNQTNEVILDKCSYHKIYHREIFKCECDSASGSQLRI